MTNICCSNLSKSYQGIQSLVATSLCLKQGSVTGLLGPNGAGKSTLIKCILGLVQADSGSVDIPAHVRIGYLPELAQLPPSVTAWQTIRLALQLSNKFSDKTAPSLLLDRVRLAEKHWHKPLRSFSKGMRQRVALAYAIAGDPQWLILDEPMSGLDVMGRKQFLEILLELNKQGIGMLVCSHIVTDLVRLCERVLLIHQGSIVDEINITEHSMSEAEALESRLMQTAEYSHE